jgi:3-carboxy-cis,cis-muconate cycloisomerase
VDTGTRSERVDALFAETATLSRYLEVEIALARTQAELGLIPERAAEAIATHATVENIERERYRRSFATVGFPIVGVVQQLTEIVPDGLGEYAHWGATTQDIMDTASVLALRDVVRWVKESIDRIALRLVELADRHRRTLMMGRSQLQHAVPITFGYKATGWLLPLLRHRERLSELRPRLLNVQFGGAVGSLAALGRVGLQVRRRLAERLGLGEPAFTWHTQRDALAEWVAFLGVLTGTLAKIATDIILLAQSEVAEVREPAVKGRGTSSTMPQKRNPVLSQQVVVAAGHVRIQVGGMLGAMVQDHERGTGTWQMEWSLVPDSASHALAALERMSEIVAGLEVDPDRMKRTLELSGGFVYAEAVMMAAAPRLGRQRAHHLVADAVDRAVERGSFLESLEDSPDLIAAVPVSELRHIFDGAVHIDAADAIVQDALASCVDSLPEKGE